VEYELAGKATIWLDKQFKGLLQAVCPGDYHERVTLHERPEANGRDLELDVLS
jgi:hypothetical protein